MKNIILAKFLLPMVFNLQRKGGKPMKQNPMGKVVDQVWAGNSRANTQHYQAQTNSSAAAVFRSSSSAQEVTSLSEDLADIALNSAWQAAQNSTGGSPRPGAVQTPPALQAAFSLPQRPLVLQPGKPFFQVGRSGQQLAAPLTNLAASANGRFVVALAPNAEKNVDCHVWDLGRSGSRSQVIENLLPATSTHFSADSKWLEIFSAGEVQALALENLWHGNPSDALVQGAIDPAVP